MKPDLYGSVNVLLGEIISSQDMVTKQIKVHMDSGVQGNIQNGVSAVHISPGYADNDVSQAFAYQPRIYMSGTGGRKSINDSKVQGHHQTLTKNSSIYANIAYSIPIRVAVSYPWKLGSKQYIYLGLWKAIDSNYGRSSRENDTKNWCVFRFTLIPWNLLKYKDFIENHKERIEKMFSEN